MRKWSSIFSAAAVASVTWMASAQATVHVKQPELSTTRTLQEQTASAAIRNYLQAWEGFRTAFEQNREDLLNRDFIGTVKDKLADTIRQQKASEVSTSYRDRAHDIQIVFYSPEGLSLELTDDVEYDVQVFEKGKAGPTQHVKTRYVVVMTPTETKWRVRVFQSVPGA